MQAIKKINNNTVVCVDRNGKQLIAMGRGLGFPQLPREISLAEIERTFYNISPQYVAAISELDPAMVDFAARITDIARNELPYELSPNAAFALADHISFMVQRARKHLRVKMPLAYDIQTLYPQEHKIARYTLERAQKEFKIGLDKQEIVGIALNFVNSRITPDTTEATDRTLQDETMLEDLIEIVEEHFGLIVERTGFNYTRYASHMQYLFDRIHAGTLIQSGNSPIYQDLKQNHPKVADCVEKIAAHLEQEWSCHLSDEEKLYIMLHVNRVCSKNQT